jgi:hypothetical protein
MPAMADRSLFVSLEILAATFLASSAWSQDFRVETDVFVADEDESVSETLTLFAGDVVYDFFLKGPDQVTCFDINRGRIVLLDRERQVQTTLTTEQLLEFSTAIRSLPPTDAARGLFHPQFDETYDEESGSLELTSPELTYSAKGVRPKIPGAAERFRTFADWYKRLNAVRPGSLPPFGRLALNAALAEKGLVPEEVRRVVVIDRPVADKRLRASSQLIYVWTLSGTDRKRIEQAAHDMANFESVSPAQFWQIDAVAARGR